MISEAEAHLDLNAEELLQRLFRAPDAFAVGRSTMTRQSSCCDSECEIGIADPRDFAGISEYGLS